MTETKAPPRYKMALLTWAAAFPLLTALKVLLNPLLAPLPVPGQTLVLTGLLISAMTYVIMPRLTRLFAAWLVPSETGVQPEEKAPIAERLGDINGCLSA